MISFCYTKKSSGDVTFTTNEHRFQHILKLLLLQILWLVCCITVVPRTKWFKHTTSKLIYGIQQNTHHNIFVSNVTHPAAISILSLYAVYYRLYHNNELVQYW